MIKKISIMPPHFTKELDVYARMVHVLEKKILHNQLMCTRRAQTRLIQP